jgi:hypothetical protein
MFIQVTCTVSLLTYTLRIPIAGVTDTSPHVVHSFCRRTYKKSTLSRDVITLLLWERAQHPET